MSLLVQDSSGWQQRALASSICSAPGYDNARRFGSILIWRPGEDILLRDTLRVSNDGLPRAVPGTSPPHLHSLCIILGHI